MRLPGATLFRSDPEEDRRLAEFEIPTALWIGFHIMGLGLIGAVAVAAVAQWEGQPVVTLVLLGLAALPWAIELKGELLPSIVFVPLALGPIAALVVGLWLDIARIDRLWDLLVLVVLMVVVADVAMGPRPVAVATTLGALGINVAMAAGAWHHTDPGQQDRLLAGTIIWLTAFWFSVGAAATVRRAALALVASREAQASLSRQQTVDERRRVARDVHDVVAHTLAVTMLHITAARMAVRRGAADEAEEALEEAESHGRASLEDVRRMVRLLRADEAAAGVGAFDSAQPDLRDVEALVERYRAAGLAVNLSLDLDAAPRQPTAELAMYRVLQEGLANAAGHGDGSADVEVEARDGAIRLRIDNPVPPEQPPGRRRPPGSSGSGLLGMRERIAGADGTLSVGLVPDGRWVVTAEVPASLSTVGHAAPVPAQATDAGAPIWDARCHPTGDSSRAQRG